MKKICYYEGKFGYENLLFMDESPNFYPNKDDVIFFEDIGYKVMYRTIDYDYDEFNVFVRKTIEEDF